MTWRDAAGLLMLAGLLGLAALYGAWEERRRERKRRSGRCTYAGCDRPIKPR